MATVVLEGIAKSFGPQGVVSGINLSIATGEFLVLVGPSGCGKSTLLRMIAGLETPDAGKISIDGRDVTALPPRDRELAMVFQSYALYPHMTVQENLAFALKLAGLPKAEIASRIAEAARILELQALLARRPSQLSGGQRQRVAIGRALVRRPRVLLFDEPLSNLDASLRLSMRGELARLHRELGATIVYVTHDQVEAMTLATRLAVLSSGRLLQVGAPLDVFRWPKEKFVAGFLGSPPMNFIDVKRAGDELQAKGFKLRVADLPQLPSQSDDPACIGVRPSGLSLSAAGQLEGEVVLVERLGVDGYVQVRTEAGLLTVRFEGTDQIATRLVPGERVKVSLDPKQIYLFDAGGRTLLPRAPASAAAAA